MTKRRELLKVVSVAGAAGAVWKKPVVDSVVLPAHAVASANLRCPTSDDCVTLAITCDESSPGYERCLAANGLLVPGEGECSGVVCIA